MSVLLRPDPLAIMDTRGAPDTHGWVAEAPAPTLVWEGWGNLQEVSPESDPTATTFDGEGPLDPTHRRKAVAYVPPEVLVEAGMLLTARGLVWWVQRVSDVLDPRNPATGALDCRRLEVLERGPADVAWLVPAQPAPAPEGGS